MLSALCQGHSGIVAHCLIELRAIWRIQYPTDYALLQRETLGESLVLALKTPHQQSFCAVAAGHEIPGGHWSGGRTCASCPVHGVRAHQIQRCHVGGPAVFLDSRHHDRGGLSCARYCSLSMEQLPGIDVATEVASRAASEKNWVLV